MSSEEEEYDDLDDVPFCPMERAISTFKSAIDTKQRRIEELKEQSRWALAEADKITQETLKHTEEMIAMLTESRERQMQTSCILPPRKKLRVGPPLAGNRVRGEQKRD